MLRISPPGFPKPLWRGWEGGVGSGAGAAAVRAELAGAVSSIQKSIGGCHREEVRRDPTNVPSSNQHLYGQKPHRSEILPVTPRKKESKGMFNFKKKIVTSIFATFILNSKMFCNF